MKDYYAEKEGIKFAAFCPCLLQTDLTKNLTAYLKENGMEEFELPNMISPDCVAQGVLILLKDKINGSILVTPPNKGFIYVDIEQKVTPAETEKTKLRSGENKKLTSPHGPLIPESVHSFSDIW